MGSQPAWEEIAGRQRELGDRRRQPAVFQALDPETMLKTWLPAGLKGFEPLQEMFFAQMGRGGAKK